MLKKHNSSKTTSKYLLTTLPSKALEDEHRFKTLEKLVQTQRKPWNQVVTNCKYSRIIAFQMRMIQNISLKSHMQKKMNKKRCTCLLLILKVMREFKHVFDKGHYGINQRTTLHAALCTGKLKRGAFHSLCHPCGTGFCTGTRSSQLDNVLAAQGAKTNQLGGDD